MNPNAVIKLSGKALTKGAEKAATKATGKAVSKATSEALGKAATKALTGAGKSTLAKGAGSTIDGIIGRSSGITLPEPKIVPVTLGERTKGLFDNPVDTVGDLMDELGVSLSDLYTDNAISKKSYDVLKEGAREADRINRSALDAVGMGSKSELPILNRDEFYYDTLGKVGKNNMRYADVPDYMQGHLSNPKNASEKFVRGGNDAILRSLFNDDTSDLSDLYARYEDLAQSDEATRVFTPENVDKGAYLMGKKGDAATQDLAERAFGNKRDINVSKTSTGAKNVKISRPTATLGVEDAVAETPNTANPELTNQIAELRSQIGSTGGAGGGTTTDMPGSEGLNVRLKTGDETTVQIGSSATGSSRRQRAVRKLDDMTAKGMNANAKQYRGLVGKSGSIDGHYKTVAERLRAEKIDQANVAEKAQAALSGREDIKKQGLSYAEANGVTMDLSGIDNKIGMSATQKRKLSELGLGLEEMLGSKKLVTPTQAEDIYKTLRDYAYNWSDSKDALTKMAGNACEKEAEAVRNIIDETMDSINVDYKTPLVEFMSSNGEDPAYIRKIAGKPDFKFSDLRKDQSDWIAMNDLAGNKIKEGPTLNVFGVDTGAPNPFTGAADRIKEKVYERQAYGAGAGGAGGSGAENTINFENVGGERTGALGNLLGRAKSAGLVGAGVLGGLLLGGGGGGGSNSMPMSDTSAMAMGGDAGTEEADPYQTFTIGGYTYDQLENGYVAAIQAGDNDAAKLIANMMSMLDDKVERYVSAQEKSSSSSSTATKQRAAMNVLSGLMGNYQSQGPIGGRFTQFMNTITGGEYNPSVAAYDSGAQGSLGTIIKALGDTGALSEGDQKRALELLPKTTDSEQAARMKYQQLMQILQGAGAQ